MQEIPSKRQLNKAKKETAFLDAAEELFKEKGFEGTSIDEVAGKAGLTKRTLYQYFLSKEDLYFAVALRGAKQLFALSEEAVMAGGNALEKVHLANLAHLRFYLDDIGMFKILNYKPANRQNCDASPHFQQITEYDGRRMVLLMNLIGLGITDRSIKPEADMKKAIFFAFFSAFSLLYTISTTDKGIWKILELEEADFLSFSFDQIMNALKP